jgi:hypothetical protein
VEDEEVVEILKNLAPTTKAQADAVGSQRDHSTTTAS